jgi:putative ABC transport system ATP-binding protein
MHNSIHVRNLRKSFRTGDIVTPVLKGIDLDIRRGEMFFIVGPSGCGKTTLISLLCGTLRADEGDIDVFGHKLGSMVENKIAEFRARQVGFIFQQFNLIPTLTNVQNVAVPLRLQGKSVAHSLKAAAAMLERVGLEQKINERPSSLSGGQQQRVAIARALVHQPELIVCDEPTSALDSSTGSQMMELLTPQPGDKSRIVIVVTHDPRIYHHADRIAEMEDGTICRTLNQAEASKAFGFHSTTHH